MLATNGISKLPKWVASIPLMPALNTIDGMGDKAAEGVVEAAKDGPFTSCENFKNRSKISGTTVDKMRELGLLGDLPLSDQMSLLDFM